jgi:hypothetical protein
VQLAVVFPLAWLVFALTLQQLTDGFPMYPFLDVADNGWPRVLFNAAVVGVFFLGLAAAAHLLDERLRGHQPESQCPQGKSRDRTDGRGGPGSAQDRPAARRAMSAEPTRQQPPT